MRWRLFLIEFVLLGGIGLQAPFSSSSSASPAAVHRFITVFKNSKIHISTVFSKKF